jgi:hypothetical protein
MHRRSLKHWIEGPAWVEGKRRTVESGSHAVRNLQPKSLIREIEKAIGEAGL